MDPLFPIKFFFSNFKILKKNFGLTVENSEQLFIPPAKTLMYVSLRCFHDSKRWRSIHYAYHVQILDKICSNWKIPGFNYFTGWRKTPNKWKTHVYLSFNVFYSLSFLSFFENGSLLLLFFQVFNNAFFMKKIQDSYWKKTIDKKKKRSKETQLTFLNIKALFSVA